MPITSNLAFGYQLDEASGNALDVLSSNDLTATNSPGSGTGKLSNCRTFNGTTQYFSKADNATLSTGDIDFYGYAWVNLAATGAVRTVASKWKNTGNQREWKVVFNGTRIQLQLSSAGSASDLTLVANSFGNLSTSTWYFVEWWHDSVNNVAGISVNGTSNTTSYSSGVFDSTADFAIGTNFVTSGADFWTGSIDEVFFFKGMPTSGERAAFYNSGSGFAYPWSAGAYTLTAAAGSFAMTGNAANLLRGLKLTAATGTFALTGNAASLLAARKLSAATGAYVVTGNAAQLKAARLLAAQAGAFVLTGNDVSLLKGRTLNAAAGSFLVTGNSASLLAFRKLAAAGGAYILTGNPATLIYSGAAAPTFRPRFILLRKRIQNSPGIAPPDDVPLRLRKAEV